MFARTCGSVERGIPEKDESVGTYPAPGERDYENGPGRRGTEGWKRAGYDWSSPRVHADDDRRCGLGNRFGKCSFPSEVFESLCTWTTSYAQHNIFERDSVGNLPRAHRRRTAVSMLFYIVSPARAVSHEDVLRKLWCWGVFRKIAIHTTFQFLKYILIRYISSFKSVTFRVGQNLRYQFLIYICTLYCSTI